MASNYDGSTSYLQSLATSAMNKVSETKGNIIQLYGGAKDITAKQVNFEFDLEELVMAKPPKFSDMFNNVDTTNPEIIRLNNEIDGFVAKYFPNLSNCLQTIPDEWLCDVISGVRPFGIDSTIFDLVWNKARDRALAQGRSEARTIAANMSSRGFSMPNGAMVDMIMALDQKTSDMIADANREAMVKDAEIKHDMLKFAVSEAVKYKIGLLSALADMYKIFAVIPNNGIERERARTAAIAAYYNAVSDYHKIEMAFDELRLKAEETKADISLKNAANDLEAEKLKMGSNEGLRALGDAARSFGDIASQSAQSAGTLVAQIESL